MDRKHLEIAHSMERIQEFHANTGYYSPEVEIRMRRLAEWPQAERLSLYETLFNDVWTTAQELRADSRYDQDTSTLDLTGFSMGKVQIFADHIDEPDLLDGRDAYRRIYVAITGFESRDIYLSDGGVSVEDPEYVDNVFFPQLIDYIETLDTIKNALPNHVNR